MNEQLVSELANDMKCDIVILIIFSIVAGFVAGWVLTYLYYDPKLEHYRQRVFELTDGKEGSNLVKVEPHRPAPTPPDKIGMDGCDTQVERKENLTLDERTIIVKRIIDGFDFEKVHSIMWLESQGLHPVPTVDDLKAKAIRYLNMTLEHTDRKFWWIGGLAGHGGLLACYDDIWGLSLNYVAVARKMRIFPVDRTSTTNDTNETN